MDLPRITNLTLLLVGVISLVGIFVGGSFFSLPDTQANLLKDIAIWCFGFATSGKALNVASEGLKARKNG
jgi:hypothetical protein